MEPSKISPRRFQDLCLCTLFLAFLLASPIALAIRREDVQVILAENRRARDFPPMPESALAWGVWPRDFEAWHDDHFGLRTALVRTHNWLKLRVLHTSPSPRIVIGPTNWIFAAGVDLEPWRGAVPFTQLELEAWRKCLEGRRRELEKRGIEYCFVLAPNKPAVYPEFLPAQIRKGGPSRTDQLIEYLAQHSSFRLIDLRAALLEEKRNDVGDDYTYFPLGTHWTDRGAGAGMRAIVAELAKTHPTLASVDDSIDGQIQIDASGDSWGERLYLPSMLRQTVRLVTLHDAKTRGLSITKTESERRVVVDQEDSSLPRALVLHDSFGEPLQVLLGRHFSHSLFLWKPDIDLQLVEQEKPAVVLHIFNDRVLATLQPMAFSTAIDTLALEQFQASRELALVFDAASNSPPIKAYRESSVTLSGVGSKPELVCRQETQAGGFLLPAFQLRDGVHAIVRIEFESPIATKSSFLFQTSAERSFHRKRQVRYDVSAGLNTLYVEILEQDLAGPLLFRPGTEPGMFKLHALEVRLVSN